MSLARVYTTKKVRKDWKCGNCGAEIKKGVDGRISFSVGFRGFERTRCTRTTCYPKPSERESSLVSSVYAAQEEFSVDDASSLEELEEAVSAVVEAMNEVAGEYQDNEMYEINYEMQERADLLESSAAELEDWASSLPEEPTEENEDSWGEHDSYEDAHEEWLDEGRSTAESAVNEVELP